MKPTLYGTALLRLAAYFKVTVQEFQTLPRELVLEWAADLHAPLRTWQHRFLIGEDPERTTGPRFSGAKLIERLSGESLAAAATASGQSIQQMAERAGVRV